VKLDFLNYPDLLSDNGTIAFQTAVWRLDESHQPKTDAESFRAPWFWNHHQYSRWGFECGKWDFKKMSNNISHYLYACDDLDCGQQVPLNPSSDSASSC
jgi:hypothetical protein